MHSNKPILATSNGQNHFDLNDIMQSEPKNKENQSRKIHTFSFYLGKECMIQNVNFIFKSFKKNQYIV